MKATLNFIVLNFLRQVKQSNRKQVRFLPVITLFLFLLSSCGKNDNASPDNPPGNSLVCKNKPSQILFGRDVSDIEYNTLDKPVKVTSTTYNPDPSQPPVTTVYTITYNAEGKANKVTKSVNNQSQLTYQMEYNPNGQLIKQTKFNAMGVLTESTFALYDNGNKLTKLITHTEGVPEDVTSFYEYANGNLIKKSMENLYDLNSKEFYTADYSYTYFPDKENKIKSYFEGPLGLLFISNVSNEQSLQYFPGRVDYQLFFARENSAEKNMLKNIEIIAHRYNAKDTTNIVFSYEYDTDGFPTVQKGSYKNVTRRYEPSPFGVPILLVTPHENSFEKTMNFDCN
ncbi:MAG: hypothetical protein EOO43_08485 [Flavobacterium sp.]|nr:MAG: hypothetical protein EOO43_08485 [Flavobacterium sp.]